MSSTALLLAPPEGPVLLAARDRVDLWTIPLAAVASETAPGPLNPDELAFASRLRIGAGEWSAARAALRRVLASYLGVSSMDVAIVTGPNGKPRLGPGHGLDLRFSLSHSGDVALIAVRLGHEVGVDVEAIRPGVDTAAIARENFDAAEREALAADLVDGSFFRAWARHEALAKATGRGVAGGTGAADGAGFRVLDLGGIPGCAAALASEGDGWSVRRL